jgi:hypothetical protein
LLEAEELLVLGEGDRAGAGGGRNDGGDDDRRTLALTRRRLGRSRDGVDGRAATEASRRPRRRPSPSIDGIKAAVTVRLDRRATLTPYSVGWKAISATAARAVIAPNAIRPPGDRGAVCGSDIMKNTKMSVSGDSTIVAQ